MGFYVDYTEMREYYLNMESWINSNLEILSNLSQRWIELQEGDGMEGEGADAIRAYISEFHMPMIESLMVLLRQLYGKLLLYTDDYYVNIDDSMNALLIEDAMTSYIDQFRSRMNMVDYFHEEAGRALESVYSICAITNPGKTEFDEIGKGLLNQMQQLAEGVMQIEEGHAGDLEEAEELSASLKGLMASFCWQMDKRMSGYSVGMLAGTPEYECLELATEMVEKDYDGVIGAIEMAVEREYLRKLADLRIQQGEEQIMNGVKSVFWGVLAIYLPGGFGIPLMTAMRVNGVVSTAYGIFEWDEGIQKQELGNIGDVTADTFNFGSDVICLGYDGVYHTIGEVSVFISKLEVSNVLWGYAARAFNSVTGTIKGLTKRIVWRKNVVGGAQGGTSARGLIGQDFEDYLSKTIGGDGSFSVGGRDFDGGIGNRWWEAKSGNYWSMLEENPNKLAKFKSDMGDRLRIATENGATYELFSNTPIPESIKQWLTKKGITYTELLD